MTSNYAINVTLFNTWTIYLMLHTCLTSSAYFKYYLK